MKSELIIVNIYELISNYREFEGKKVKTCGFFIFSNETGLYPNFTDYKYNLLNKIYMIFDKKNNIESLKKLNKTYCMIEGTVLVGDKGPWGLYAFTLDKVNSVSLARRLDKDDMFD
jgi:hypothetical protein